MLRRVLIALLLLSVTSAACAHTGSRGPDAAELRGGSLAATFDLSGTRFTVGSKEFTENLILGKILIYALRAAGAEVTDQTGLTGTGIVRRALISQDIDMYWEYSGTGWSLFLGHTDPIPGAMEQFTATATDDLAQYGVRWLGPARFGNQYAIARAGDAPPPVAEVTRLSQLTGWVARHEEHATFCGAAEFLDRRFRDFERIYAVTFPPPQVYQNDFALNFVNVAKGSPCNFAEVFTTDARIKALDLTVLQDDRGAFFTELAAVTLLDSLYAKHPQLGPLVEALGAKLTVNEMIDLNGLVDLDGKSADDAAVDFLRRHGFIATG